MAVSDWTDQARALIAAVKDLKVEGAGVRSGQHSELFDRYVAEMTKAKTWADGWWQSLHHKESERTPDPNKAAQNIRIRWPVGPVAHPAVVATVRRFWLECDSLNRQVDPKNQIAPEQLLLGWLMESDVPELAEFLSGLPYWPIGMDADGNWA